MGSLAPPPDPSTTTTSSLRRRISLSGAPPAKLLGLPSAADVELVSFGNASLAYTSLKDIIPALPSAPPMSPADPAGHSWGEIPIRNRLVKQAAWAYLQPMAASSQSAAGGVFHRIADDLRDHLAAGLHFFRRRVVPAISRALGCLFGVLWLGLGGAGGDEEQCSTTIF